MPPPDAAGRDETILIEDKVPWVLPITNLIGEMLGEVQAVVRLHPEDNIPSLFMALAALSEQTGRGAASHEPVPPAFWPTSAAILRSLAVYAATIPPDRDGPRRILRG
jgi:hypothetical protein